MRNIVFFTFLMVLSLIIKGQAKQDISSFPLHVQLKNTQKPVVFYLSGDGGWNTFSQKLIAELSQSGYSTIGLDCKAYFWRAKTPEQFTADAQVIINYYMQMWHKSEFAIVGYSFGADVGVFLPNRLPKNLLAKMRGLTLLSLGSSTDFTIRLMDMAGIGKSSALKYKTGPELNKCPVSVLCIFGEDEDLEFKTSIKESERLHKVVLPGAHRYDNNSKAVAQSVIRGINADL